MPPRPIRDAEVTFPVGAANLPTINSVCQLDTATGNARLPSAASVAPIGVAQADATASKEITVLQEGIARCVASAAISIGDFVEIADATGKVRTKAQTSAGPLVLTQSLTPAAVAANTTAEQSFVVAGLAANDVITGVSKPTAQAGLGIVGVRYIDATHIGVTFSNNTAAPITPTAAETYTFTGTRGATAGGQTQPTPIVGRALTAASASGDFVDVLLMIGANY